MNKLCPDCGGALEKVVYPEDSMLNRYQFDAIRAGDFFCRRCKGNQAKTGFRYFWKSDLEQQTDPRLMPRAFTLRLRTTDGFEEVHFDCGHIATQIIILPPDMTSMRCAQCINEYVKEHRARVRPTEAPSEAQSTTQE